MKADSNHSVKLGNFPILEASYELQYAINHALVGSYKAAFADLRSSLELCLIIPFFTKDNFDKCNTVNFDSDEKLSFIDKIIIGLNSPEIFDIDNAEIKKANDWVKGNSNTPFFNNMLKELIKSGRFKEIYDIHRLKENICSLYHCLSDYEHNRGYEKSYYNLNQSSLTKSSIHAPSINESTLKTFCDLYLKTVQHNIVILSLYNPLVLEGLPLEQKFGFNEPSSGFFSYAQSESLWELLPNEYRSFFETIKTTDFEVIDGVDWVMSRPDITEEEFRQQVIHFNEMITNFKFNN